MAAMPTADDPRVVVRLSRETHERLVAVAGPRGVAGFVRRAIEGLLDPPVVDRERLERDVLAMMEPPPKAFEALMAESEEKGTRLLVQQVAPSDAQVFKCPAGHDFTTTARAAKCFCNRPVVPA